MPRFLLAVVLLLVLPPFLRAQDFETYQEEFVRYWEERSLRPETLPNPDDYLAASHYDRLHGPSVESFVGIIRENQNMGARMAWGSSHLVYSLNDMFVATGDVKYLEWNLDLVRATMAATDEKNGRETFYGEVAPAWGTPHYRGEHTVHIVHTGMISGGVGQFLNLAEPHGAAIGLPPEERDQHLKDLTRALDFHDRQWVAGSLEDEGTWTLMDESEGHEDRVVPFNMMSSMGASLWWSWENTGNREHYERAHAVARYIRNRLPIYERDGVRAYFWNYYLDEAPVENPRPWAELAALRGGEDFSHAALSASFPIMMAERDVVFTREDIELFRNTALFGFARHPGGILTGNIAGYPGRHEPRRVGGCGYWLALAPHFPEVYERLLPFFFHYQARPRSTDLARLLRYTPY